VVLLAGCSAILRSVPTERKASGRKNQETLLRICEMASNVCKRSNTSMSRPVQIFFGVFVSLAFDVLLWWIVYRRARIKDYDPSVWWWLLTIVLAVIAIIPLFELARGGHLLERVLAGLLSTIPVSWLGFCAYSTFQ
jgi:uncharacterized membrane protein YhaH (DUF805 family)